MNWVLDISRQLSGYKISIFGDEDLIKSKSSIGKLMINDKDRSDNKFLFNMKNINNDSNYNKLNVKFESKDKLDCNKLFYILNENNLVIGSGFSKK